MMNNQDFTVFILTHGRPDRQDTYESLNECGYTGRIIFVVDDEDKTVEQYKKRFKEQVYVFNKKEKAKTFDTGDNFDDRRVIIFARNVCFDIAKELGIKYFIELDDDYTIFRYTLNEKRQHEHRSVTDLDGVFDAMLDFYKSIPAHSIAMAQGGDLMGGSNSPLFKKIKRKAMNTFICSTDRQFDFVGRINEDVNVYTNLGSRGAIFLTIPDVVINQRSTQSNTGGMTDAYLDSGTYVKSFYSVMYQPSSVKISTLGRTNHRIHHAVSWKYTLPQILSPKYKKGEK